jgi:hypothetical protein
MEQNKIMNKTRLVLEVNVSETGNREEVLENVGTNDWKTAVEDFVMDELDADKVVILEAVSDMYSQDENGEYTVYEKTLVTI